MRVTCHSHYPEGVVVAKLAKYSSKALTFYQNDLAKRNTADVTGNSIVVWSQSISGVGVVNT
jgi:hypothetical protein